TLLPVARDEGHRAAFVEELQGVLHLPGLEGQLAGQHLGHVQHSRRLKPRIGGAVLLPTEARVRLRTRDEGRKMALEARDLPHYTFEDYERWEGRWELIYGIPYAMSPQPNLKHQRVSGNIHSLLA